MDKTITLTSRLPYEAPAVLRSRLKLITLGGSSGSADSGSGSQQDPFGVGNDEPVDSFDNWDSDKGTGF